MLGRVMRGMNRYFDRGQHLHDSLQNLLISASLGGYGSAHPLKSLPVRIFGLAAGVHLRFNPARNSRITGAMIERSTFLASLLANSLSVSRVAAMLFELALDVQPTLLGNGEQRVAIYVDGCPHRRSDPDDSENSFPDATSENALSVE